MKTIISTAVPQTNKSTAGFWLVLLFFVQLQVLSSQSLKEIPNPDNLTLSAYMGGGNGYQFFEYIDANYKSHPHYYNNSNGQLKAIPLPGTVLFSWYLLTVGNQAYFYSFDQSSNYKIHAYDGSTLTTMTYPSGFSFNQLLSGYNEKLYTIGLHNSQGFKLFSYDGTSNVQKAWPAGYSYQSFIGSFKGMLYFTLLDQNQIQHLFSYDDISFTQITSPANTYLSAVVHYATNYLMLLYEETNGVFGIIRFDGNTLTKIQNPAGYHFSWQIVAKNQEENSWYISYLDTLGKGSIFLNEGNTLTKLDNPIGYSSPFFINSSSGTSYFLLVKDADSSSRLFRTEGEYFQLVNQPAGTKFSQYLDTFLGKIYYSFFDQNDKPILMSLSETGGSIVALTPPAGYTYLNYASKTATNIFFNYYNSNNVASLFTFDGTAFSQIPNPNGKYINHTLTTDNRALYLRYDHLNSSTGTLYKLRFNNSPTSENITIATNINVPYSFESSDFYFQDTDLDDELVSIAITETVSVGELLVDGSPVNIGDVILESELALLTFTPNTGEFGTNYDAFKYKVFDGNDLSDAAYTLTIDVENSTSAEEQNLHAAKISLYPVPSKTYMQLEVETAQPIGSMNLAILSATGQLLQQRQLNSSGTVLQQTIDVSALPAGNFVLIGKTNEGNIVKQPFVVSR